MIRNYTGRTIHLRQQNGDLLTLPNLLRHLPVVRNFPKLVGSIHGMALSYHDLEILNLPPETEDVDDGDVYLVSEVVFHAARQLGRLDCVTLDYTSGRPLQGGPIMGSGYEYSRLRTPYEYADEVEADEPVVVGGGGWTRRMATFVKAVE